jgi:hypothetical protein
MAGPWRFAQLDSSCERGPKGERETRSERPDLPSEKVSAFPPSVWQPR